MTDPVRPLNARQRRFIDAYIQEGNAADAAVRAGYRPWAARQTGHELLQRPDIQAEIAARRAQAAVQLTRRSALEELARVAYSNVMDYAQIDEEGRMQLDLSRMDRARAAGVRELTLIEVNNAKDRVFRRTLRIRMGNKPQALRLLLANLPAEGEAAG